MPLAPCSLPQYVVKHIQVVYVFPYLRGVIAHGKIWGNWQLASCNWQLAIRDITMFSFSKL
jgi:hypothetical protein